MSVQALVGYRPLIPTTSPLSILTPISYRRADFPAYLWDEKAFPVIADPRLRDPKVSPVDGHQAVITDIAFLAPFKVNLQCREERGGGGVKEG